jgi:methyl-accepting chemotaxis protein
MSENSQSYKRRQYFIKREFQFKFILKFFILILVGAVISTGLLLLFSQGTLTTSFQHSRILVKDTSLAIFPAVIYTNLITLGLIATATIIVLLFLSHKIAGPLFRFEKEIKRIEKGDFTTQIRLRRKDQIIDVAETLNTMVTSLNGKISDIKSDMSDIKEYVSEHDVPDDLASKIEALYQKFESGFII